MAEVFEYEGKMYDFIKVEDWYVKETRDIERWVGGEGMSDAGYMSQISAAAAVSIARGGGDATILDLLNTWTNRDMMKIADQINAHREATVRAEAEQLVADAQAVLSPTNGGPSQPAEQESPSSQTYSNDGGSQLSPVTTSTPVTSSD